MKKLRSTRPSSHLGRLDRIWLRDPIFFVTLCAIRRKKCLTRRAVHDILVQEMQISAARYGWCVGRYVVMPDHIYLFCAAIDESEAKPLVTFVGKFKEWSAKRLHRQLGLMPPIWQPEFFDHVLRSNESYLEKSLYVFENPVRAGLVERSEEWPFAGELSDI